MVLTVNFETAAQESAFRRALSKVPVYASILRDENRITFAVRPVNLLQFGQAINARGLEFNITAKAILRFWDKAPNHYLEIRHDL